VSARVVQKYVLNELRDEKIDLYLVWGPMLGGEQESDARKATVFLQDPRVHHFWTPKHAVARQFAKPLVLRDELAWDTFQLHAAGAEWKDALPVPIYYMHVGRSLPSDRRFNGEKLAAEIRRILGKARPGSDGHEGHAMEEGASDDHSAHH